MLTSTGITLAACSLLLLTRAAGAEPAPLISGEPIPVGATNGVGPMAIPAISGTPLGCARVFGSAQPDLFVAADKWYPGFYLYQWLATARGGVPVFAEPIPLKTL